MISKDAEGIFNWCKGSGLRTQDLVKITGMSRQTVYHLMIGKIDTVRLDVYQKAVGNIERWIRKTTINNNVFSNSLK